MDVYIVSLKAGKALHLPECKQKVTFKFHHTCALMRRSTTVETGWVMAAICITSVAAIHLSHWLEILVPFTIPTNSLKRLSSIADVLGIG